MPKTVFDTYPRRFPAFRDNYRKRCFTVKEKNKTSFDIFQNGGGFSEMEARNITGDATSDPLETPCRSNRNSAKGRQGPAPRPRQPMRKTPRQDNRPVLQGRPELHGISGNVLGGGSETGDFYKQKTCSNSRLRRSDRRHLCPDTMLGRTSEDFKHDFLRFDTPRAPVRTPVLQPVTPGLFSLRKTARK